MSHVYEFQALANIWTGDANTAQSKEAKRLILTGMLGSIRWWFEVLVRGLGGVPCDPSSNKKGCLNETHCVVCELFGCTGWARKFHFDVLDAQGAVQTAKLTEGMTFYLRFTPLRAVKAEEWTLLELTLRLISEFGALGGKTVLKPSTQNTKPQHADFGLVRLTDAPKTTETREQLAQYVSAWTKRPIVSGVAWASCSHMWFVDGKYLTRQDQNTSTFNRVIGRPEPKASSSQGDSLLAGRCGESKKVFSFKSPSRTFGFVQQTSELAGVRDELRTIWNQPSTNDWFVTGDALLARLFTQEETP